MTGEQIIGGFSIEVFKAVVNRGLSDPIEYDLYPFAKSDGSFNGSFDAMLRAVSNKVPLLYYDYKCIRAPVFGLEKTF